MDLSCLVSTAKAAGVTLFGIFSWHTLLNNTVYFSLFGDHVHPFISTIYGSANDFASDFCLVV